jgi:hypothetical protein
VKNDNKVYMGELAIGNLKFPCAVLPDGTRVLTESGIHKHFGATGGKSIKVKKAFEKKRGSKVPMFVASLALAPYIDQIFKEEDLIPIKFRVNNTVRRGYKAEILAKVCEVWLRARDNNALQGSQHPKAAKAEILMRAIAYTGITALIDEATGYEDKREPLELQKILNAYISEETAKWQMTFHDDFYEEMFRLWCSASKTTCIKKKPRYFGYLTNKYVYSQMPEGVFEALKKNTPKNASGKYKRKLHQALTEEIGREHLKKQITEVTTLMSISDSKEQFIRLFERRFNKSPQLNLEID